MVNYPATKNHKRGAKLMIVTVMLLTIITAFAQGQSALAENIRLLRMEYIAKVENEGDKPSVVTIDFFDDYTCEVFGTISGIYDWSYVTQWTLEDGLKLANKEGITAECKSESTAAFLPLLGLEKAYDMNVVHTGTAEDDTIRLYIEGRSDKYDDALIQADFVLTQECIGRLDGTLEPMPMEEDMPKINQTKAPEETTSALDEQNNAQYYHVKEISNGVYCIYSVEASFMYLFVGEDKALLLDTGWGLGDLAATVRQITDKPLYLVNSHGHVDHVNGNLQFDTEVYIHPNDIPLATVHGSVILREYILMLGEALAPSGFDRDRYLKDAVPEFVPVTEGYVFDLGGKTLEVIEIFGHTEGSIGLLYREEKTLFAGDAITRMVLMSGPESTKLDVYTKSLEKVTNIDISSIYHGHSSEAHTKEIAVLLKEVAQNADWESAEVYRDSGNPDAEANESVRILCPEGMSQEDIMNPAYVSIVVAADKLNIGE